MFENWNVKPFPSQPGVDIYQIIREAQTRWLRPIEVIEILRNHHIFRLNPVPPTKPPSGSLFLFDRKTLRFFRKDGHNWRKKKDGKTIREAHERLKAGSVDILHCYYAHGEDNVNFQRRSYWMLEGAYEHIVLVHYREVTEGSRTCIVRAINEVKEVAAANAERDSYSLSTSTQNRLSETLPLPHTFSSSENSEVEVTGPYQNQSPESGADSAVPDIEEIDSGDEVEEISVPASGTSEQRSSLLQQVSSQSGKGGFLNLDFSTEDRKPSDTFLWGGGKGLQPHPHLSQSKYFINTKERPDSYQRPMLGNHGNERGLLDPNQEPLLKHPVSRAEITHTTTHNDLLQNREKGFRQKVVPSATLDISGWSTLLENFRGAGTPEGVKRASKQDLKSPTWEDMLDQVMTQPAQNSKSSCLASKDSVYPVYSAIGEPKVSLSSQGYNISASVNVGDSRESPLECIIQNHPSGAAPKVEACKNLVTSQPWSSTVLDQFLHDGQHEEAQLVTMKEAPVLNHFDPNFWEQKQKQQYCQEQNQGYDSQVVQDQSLFLDSDLQGLVPALSRPLDIENNQDNIQSFKKLDSFGKWMNHEMAEYADGSFMSSGTNTFWPNTLDDQGSVEPLTSFSQQMQMDIGLSPSLAQEQRFSIIDFSPDWAFSSGESKVVIVGKFLERDKNFSDYSWCCMFGELEVPAEVLQVGVLRCKAPPHEPMHVPFYVTCQDRLACSEIREFQYRMQGSITSEDSVTSTSDPQSTSLLVRFARMLSCKSDEPLPTGDLESREELGSEDKICHLTSNSHEEWENLVSDGKAVKVQYPVLREQILQIFLKQKLKDWLLSKVHGESRGVCIFDDMGQGVLHLAASLGYDWAIAPILAAGVGVNFRDLHGWTALHWAAFFGREKVVLALLGAGAAPGPLTDPTPSSPSGRTPADLAASSGHGGMAGYLAEMSLITHLSSLALKEKNMNEIETFSATLAEEKAVDYLSEKTNLQQNSGGADEHVTLQESLRAVRNAARAAALIQATFRRHSFRKRQDSLELEVLDNYTMSQEQVKAMSATQKIQKSSLGNQKDKLHAAAVQIQCKYRSWKGRKDFLSLRRRVVKIQAHVRGHQVRKKFRKLLWSVGILEKAVLRWRRKGVGLRGFRREAMHDESNSDGDEEVLRAGRKEKEAAIQNAVTRVQSMVKSNQARAQYRRLAEGYRHATTVEDGGEASDCPSNHTNPTGEAEDYIMYGGT